MRKFFTRFAGNQQAGNGTAALSNAGGEESRDRRTLGINGNRQQVVPPWVEKSGLEAVLPSPTSGQPGRERSATGERVKALAARYETLSAAGNAAKSERRASSPPANPQIQQLQQQQPQKKGATNGSGATPSSPKGHRSIFPTLNPGGPGKELPQVPAHSVKAAEVPPQAYESHRLPQSARLPSDEILPAVLSASARVGTPKVEIDEQHAVLQEVQHQQLVDEIPQARATKTIRRGSEGASASNVGRRPLTPPLQHREVARDAAKGQLEEDFEFENIHQQQQQPMQKSVAFAPSPKKPRRPTSPPAPMPETALDDVARHLSGHTSSLIGNFARPTAASSARARGGVGQAASTSANGSAGTSASGSRQGPLTASTSLQGTERFPSVGSTSRPPSSSMTNSAVAPKIKRSNSASASGRRGASGGSASSYGVSEYATFGARRSLGAGSHISLLQGGRESSTQLPNSIPFVTSPALGLLRSASPQSIGTGSSTSGVHDFLSSSSRRASVQGRFNSGGSAQAFASSVRSIGAPSWSQMTQDDLVSNLGARERTRQEVLWEIVASEERYVQELEKTMGLYLDPLLHPHRILGAAGAEAGSTQSGATDNTAPDNAEHKGNAELPIASRFMSPLLGKNGSGNLSPSSTSLARADRLTRPTSEGGLSPSQEQDRAVSPNKKKDAATQRQETKKAKTKSQIKAEGSKKETKKMKRVSQVGYNLMDVPSLTFNLPMPLRIVLEAIDNGILEGHVLLSEALRVRYEEQWPLVRSLADVFSRFSYVMQHYRDYVVNLERALDCLEEAALMERAMRGKRLRKERLSTTVALGRAVASLDAAAVERGECGLAIFLSMPFQRLLKYPLLFQNLLFHTDASTFEFESTVQMVVDVERIVRTIEDEKVNKEERDKTIDAFARIEGIKDRALLRPKADRFLIEERPTYEENPRRAISESNDPGMINVGGQSIERGASPQSDAAAVSRTAMSTPLGLGSGNLRASVKTRRSYRRLSDLLTNRGPLLPDDATNTVTYTKAPSMGSKRDIWLVRFSDVELRCQRVGVTALPMISALALHPSQIIGSNGTEAAEAEVNGVNEEEARMRDEFKRTRESKERMRALRNTTLRSKTRNLYKFIGVSSWKAVRERPASEGIDGLDGLATALQEEDEEEEEDEDGLEDEEEGDESGGEDADSNTSQETDGGMLDQEHYIRQSKLSFSYGGHDRIEPKLSARSSSGTFRSPRTSTHGHPNNLTPGRRGSALTNDAMNSMHPPVALKRHSMGSQSQSQHASFNSLMQSPSTSQSPSNATMTHSRAVVLGSRTRTEKFGSRLRTDDVGGANDDT